MPYAHEPFEHVSALTDEERTNLFGYLEAVRDIVDDLQAQGFTIVDGKLIPPSPHHR